MATTTVRVDPSTRDAISRLSRSRGTTTASLLADLVTKAEDDELLAGMNAAFEQARSDPEAWAAEEAGRGAWEATLLDGLRDL